MAAKKKAPKAKGPRKVRENNQADGLCTFAIRIEPKEREAIHAAAMAKNMSASAWAKEVLAKAASK